MIKNRVSYSLQMVCFFPAIGTVAATPDSGEAYSAWRLCVQQPAQWN